jgi:inhibitor of cysteine peptidase
MKRIFFLTIIGLVLILAVTACGSNGVKVDESMAGQTITVKSGEVITVNLAGNPTTGYNWYTANLDTSILSQQGDPDFKADTTAIGSGGMVTLKFKAESAGTTTLTLNYMRIWETEVPPAQTFTVTIVVE